jgi:flagellar biosynthesis protein FliR
MILILILAVALIGIAFALTIRTLFSSAAGFGERISQIAAYGFSTPTGATTAQTPHLRAPG